SPVAPLPSAVAPRQGPAVSLRVREVGVPGLATATTWTGCSPRSLWRVVPAVRGTPRVRQRRYRGIGDSPGAAFAGVPTSVITPAYSVRRRRGQPYPRSGRCSIIPVSALGP